MISYRARRAGDRSQVLSGYFTFMFPRMVSRIRGFSLVYRDFAQCQLGNLCKIGAAVVGCSQEAMEYEP